MLIFFCMYLKVLYWILGNKRDTVGSVKHRIKMQWSFTYLQGIIHYWANSSSSSLRLSKNNWWQCHHHHSQWDLPHLCSQPQPKWQEEHLGHLAYPKSPRIVSLPFLYLQYTFALVLNLICKDQEAWLCQLTGFLFVYLFCCFLSQIPTQLTYSVDLRYGIVESDCHA